MVLPLQMFLRLLVEDPRRAMGAVWHRMSWPIRQPRQSTRAVAVWVRDLFFLLPALWVSRQARFPYVGDWKLAVFVSESPHAREARIASALIRRGWRVVLLYKHSPNFAFARYFSEVRRFNGKWEALFRTSQYAPTVYHLFSWAGDSATWKILDCKGGPAIFDPKDVAPLMGSAHPLAAALEKRCLRRAQALCCKDLQVRGYEREWRLRLTPRKIWFPDLCDEVAAGTQARCGDDIRVVNVGFIPDEVGQSGGIYPVVKALAESGVDVHLYPNKHLPADISTRSYSRFVELGDTTGRVHVHPVVAPEQLKRDLCRYDFGMLLAPYGARGYDEVHFRYCGSSRLADYLAAGLGLIISRELAHQRFVARRYSAIIDADEVFRSDIRERLKEVRSARGSTPGQVFRFTVDQQIARLERFYYQVAADAAARPA